MVHQAGRVTDTVSGQINEPVPRQRHTQGRKKINQPLKALHWRCDHSRLEQP